MTIGKLVDQHFERASEFWRRPPWWSSFIVTPYVLLLLFFLLSPKLSKALIERQQTTCGVVTKYEPEEHSRYQYSFTVKGQSYTGGKSAMKGKYAIEQQVMVFYDPEDPKTNKLTGLAYSEPIIGPVFFCTVGIIGVAVCIFWRRRSISEPNAK